MNIRIGTVATLSTAIKLRHCVATMATRSITKKSEAQIMIMRLTRRELLAAFATNAVAQSGIALGAPMQSLGDIAAANGFMFGAAASAAIFKDAAYRHLYVTQTRIMTTDTALKIGAIAPRPGPKHFERGDRLLAFCNDHHIRMRGHCLIWNEWVPGWIKAMSNAERRRYFDAYIEDVVGHYAGRLHSWDVVNEPFWPGHHAPGGFRVGPWYDAFDGPDYIRRAFVRAARADKSTRFVLNEAQTERDDELGLTIRRDLLKLVADLKHAGVKLDAVGLESHVQPQYPQDLGRYAAFLHDLASLGVDIYLTEFDVRDDIFPDDIKTRDAKVAAFGGRFLDAALRNPAVKILITWELSDEYSFYKGIWQNKHPLSTRLPRPLPYDAQMQRKPLWHAIARSLANAPKRA